LTESKIKEALLQAIEGTRIGEEIFLAIFYFSDRDLIHALLKADQRGVNIRLIMDPNKDAFGYEKIGIPNRQVARELRKKSDARIKIRWYDTRGEQFHTKLAYIAHHNGPSRVILGSANFTRRNLDDYNLESDVQVIAPGSSIFVQDAKTYLERIWNNLDASYSLDYAAYADDSILKYLIYRFQEWSGLSSF
jgi:phosphatidylserine/phosphatidylglycerophosphate/cardiolipin synthase-like enzyme